MAPESNLNPTIIRFGKDFELDLRAHQLRRAGRTLRLAPIPMDILRLLAERPGELVSREEIVEKIWGQGTFFDTDNGINGAVRKIRQVISDDSENPRYIQTVSRKGYRFIAPVEYAEAGVRADGVNSGLLVETSSEVEAEAGATGELQASALANIARDSKWAARDWHRGSMVVASIALVVAVAGASYLTWSRVRGQPKASAASRAMLAVLPFENLTGDAAQDYLSDGLTEEMISQVGRADPARIGVTARTSAMHYKHTTESLPQIGRELGVQYVLEGGLRRDGSHVRVNAELIQVKDQARIWSREYDREMPDLLNLQNEIAHEISDEVETVLGGPADRATLAKAAAAPAAAAHGAAQSYEAYDLYLKGRYAWGKRTPQGFEQAARYFEQAVEKDPQYARAYAGLADTYAMVAAYGMGPATEMVPKARAAALKALDLDEKLAEAHASLALLAQNYDWDWQTSEKEFRRAIELDPNYATGHHWYAEHLALLGRFDEAFPEMQHALQLDPLSLSIQADNGAILYFSHQYDRAILQFRSVLDADPGFSRAHLLAFTYAEDGRYDDALADIDKWQSSDLMGWADSTRACIYARTGRRAEAERVLQQMRTANRHTHARPQFSVDPLTLVSPNAELGNKDEAFNWLVKAMDAHSPGLTALKVDPIYYSMRSDPRYAAALSRSDLAALAALLDGLRKFPESQRLYTQALNIYRRQYGTNHAEIAVVLNNLGAVFYVTRRPRQAAAHYLASLQMKRRILGHSHPDVAVTMNNLALLYRSQGDRTSASRWFCRALRILNLTLGQRHPSTRSVRANYRRLRDGQALRYSICDPHLPIGRYRASRRFLGKPASQLKFPH